jgi:hypothetical protein
VHKLTVWDFSNFWVFIGDIPIERVKELVNNSNLFLANFTLTISINWEHNTHSRCKNSIFSVVS